MSIQAMRIMIRELNSRNIPPTQPEGTCEQVCGLVKNLNKIRISI